MEIIKRNLQLVQKTWMNGHYQKWVSEESSLEQLIDSIRKGTYRKNIEDYRTAKSQAQGKIQKEDFVPSFMPHGYILDKKVKLKNEHNVTEHNRWEPTGYLHIDLDKIPYGDVQRVKAALQSTNPVAMFQSPSGDGIKVFYVHNVPCMTVQQKEDFTVAVRFYIRALLERLDLGNYYDPAACDPSRQCYFSFDPEAFYQAEEQSEQADLLNAYNALNEKRKELQQCTDAIKDLCKVVRNDINAGVVAQRDEEVQRRLLNAINTGKGGNNKSFALACFMIKSGVPYNEMLMNLEMLHSALRATWKPAEKIQAAMEYVGQERNRFASEMIEVDAGIDTVKYNELCTRIHAIEKYIKAGKETVQRKYNDLALSIIGTAPRSTNLVRLEHEYVEQAESIFSALHMNRVVTVVENAGSGKSRTMGALADCIALDMLGGESNWRGMLFCTNTRANRDAFQKANPEFQVWKGTSEIVFEITKNRGAEMKCGEYYADPDFEGSVIQQLYKDGIITSTELQDIQVAVLKNRAKMKSKFVTCCHAKVQVGEAIKSFNHYVVVFDEMAADDVMYIEENEKVKVFNGNVEVQAQDPEHEKVVQDFMQVIAKREGGVVMLSAEKSLLRAFGTKEMPNLKMKRLFPEITYSMCHVGAPKVLEDEKLSCVVVKSLANSNSDTRSTIADLLRKNDYFVISDGKDETGKAIGDITIEGCKGSNEMMTRKTAVLIGSPCPEAIGDMMMRLGCNEETALSVIISDQANQAIGRNVGYRNRGAECLLVVAANNLKNGRSLELDVLTPYCFDVASKEKLDNSPIAIQTVFGSMVKSLRFLIDEVATACIDLIKQQPTAVKIVAAFAKEQYKEMGMSKRDLDCNGVLTATYTTMQYRGCDKKRMYVNAVQGTYWTLA
ncbi:BT4734/BF3469 family protein [Aeromonas lacus]